MLSLGQKVTLRKAIRPFGDFYREVRSKYSSYSQELQKDKLSALTVLEDKVMLIFDSIKDMHERKEWSDTIKAECRKMENRDYDLFRDDDFGDGFRPVKKEEGATAYDERPVFPQEAKPKHPEAVGCFGKQIESTFQKELGLGE